MINTTNPYIAPSCRVEVVTLRRSVLINASNQPLRNVEQGNAGNDWYD